MEGLGKTVVQVYIPLYRKYRPQQFSDLVGQEVFCTAIQNALTLQKIAHAYLFCGPRGTGKTSSARIMAKSLNCINGPTITPCQTCPSCVSVTRGSALDVTEIDAASNNGVDSIRDLTDKVQFSPIEGKYKIYIIDEVHMLSTAAFNALLKTLEEPPPNVVFIFATTEPHKVLPTIISRCQRFDFSRITREQIEARIQYVAAQEQTTIAPEAVTLIARHVKGGMRDALSMLDQVSVLGRSSAQGIQPEDVRAFIGALEEDLLLEITQGILEKQPVLILEQIQRLLERGVEPGQIIKELTLHFRNLLIAKTCGSSASAVQLDISPDLYQKLSLQVQGFETEELPQMLTKLGQLETQLRFTQQPLLWLEVGLLDLCYREEIYLVKQLSERVHALEDRLAGATIPVKQASIPPQKQPAFTSSTKLVSVPSPPVAQPELKQEAVPTPVKEQPALPEQPVIQQESPPQSAQTDLGQIWQRTLDAIVHMPTKALVKDYFSLLEMDEQTIAVGYSASMIYETFKRTPDKPAHLEQAFTAVLGKSYRITYQAVQPGKVEKKPVQAFENTVATASPPVVREDIPSPANNGAPSATLEAMPLEVPPKFDEPELNMMQSIAPPEKQAVSLADASVDFELQEAKQFAQDLLQAKIID